MRPRSKRPLAKGGRLAPPSGRLLACKVQQKYKPLSHRAKFAFVFNTPAKPPLERNKRDNKQEQPKEQAMARS
jgi:hypothetical protein